MILLLDIGNTRIKWATLVDHRLGQQFAVVHTGQPASAIGQVFDAAIADRHPPTRVVVSNVGGDAIETLCSNAGNQRFGFAPEFLRASRVSAGVTSAYLEPAKLGVDRWLAMIGGFSIVRGTVCVVSVGTAMTIDVVDAAGQHLGGVIAPGPTLMRESLLRNTSDIAPRMQDATPSESILANHTQAAVINGCQHALAALIDRVLREAHRRTGETPKVLITGGALTSLVSFVEPAHEIVEDLVLRGMAAVIGR